MKVTACRLPHWARVAFATRCARQVYPYFLESWPDALPKYDEAVRRAITLAEVSSRTGRPATELKEAVLNALMTAGGALVCIYALPDDPLRQEPAPRDNDAAVLASLAAKVAEKAAEAALAAPPESAAVADEAYGFTVDVSHAANQPELLDSLAADFAALYRVAKRGRWSDETPVPLEVFSLLQDEQDRPWWRFW